MLIIHTSATQKQDISIEKSKTTTNSCSSLQWQGVLVQANKYWSPSFAQLICNSTAVEYKWISTQILN